MKYGYKKIVFVNFRHRKDGGVYICWLPMHELFIAKGLEKASVAENIELYTVYTHEDPRKYFDQWKDADFLIFWDTYARSSHYVSRYFDLAQEVKAALSVPTAFGGYWATSYGEDYSEFSVFDTIIRGYSIDGVVKLFIRGIHGNHVHEAFGPSAYDKYELDLSYIRTDPNKYVVFDTVQGYFSSFGCPKRCSFCINDLYRRLGAPFCPRSAEQVKQDIDTLAAFIEFSAVNFKDSNFFYDLDRAQECLNHVRSKGKNINYNLDVTVRDANDRFFERMEDMGAEKHFFFGLESFVLEERKIFGKPYSDEELGAFFERAERHSFNISGNLMFGFPFQTEESILSEVDRAIASMRKHPHLSINANAYIPKSGTAMQHEHFFDLHHRLAFEQLVAIYHSNIEEFQEIIYGDRFNGINLAMLKKGFAVLLAIRMLRQHLPPFANAFLGMIRAVTENHVRHGATNPWANAVLRPLNVTKIRRVLTRASIRYRRQMHAVGEYHKRITRRRADEL